MNKLLLALCAVVALGVDAASAQQSVKVCVEIAGNSGGASCQNVSASNPLPVTSAGGGTSSNLTQVNSAAVNVGTGTAGTGTQRVAVASDSSIVLGAGSAIAGNVGIDQTTPGTTNGVALKAATVGGCTPGYIITTASLNGTNVKNGATTLCWFNIANNTAALCYAKIYNETGVPVPSTDSAAVVQNYMDPASVNGAGSNPAIGSFGMALGTGFGFAVTGGLAANDATNAGTGCVVNYGFK